MDLKRERSMSTSHCIFLHFMLWCRARHTYVCTHTHVRRGTHEHTQQLVMNKKSDLRLCCKSDDIPLIITIAVMVCALLSSLTAVLSSPLLTSSDTLFFVPPCSFKFWRFSFWTENLTCTLCLHVFHAVVCGLRWDHTVNLPTGDVCVCLPGLPDSRSQSDLIQRKMSRKLHLRGNAKCY